MDVVTQFVRTWWTKQSRGGSAAAHRNALPVAFPLSQSAPPFVHEITMDEQDQFQPHARLVPGIPDRAVVQLRETDGSLRVMLMSAQYHDIVRRRRPATRLRAGEWLRWQINYRFRTYTGHGPWRYRLDTLNLGYHTEATPHLFLGAPTHYIDERAQLR